MAAIAAVGGWRGIRADAVFAQKWLETTGKILGGNKQFRFDRTSSGVPAMVVASTPDQGNTRAGILYQTLIDPETRSQRRNQHRYPRPRSGVTNRCGFEQDVQQSRRLTLKLLNKRICQTAFRRT